MTFEELLELPSQGLESLTDEQLLIILQPCLKNCPPVEMKLVEENEAREKAVKDEKKVLEKAKKEQQKELIESLKPLEERVVIKPLKKNISKLGQLEQMKRMMLDLEKLAKI